MEMCHGVVGQWDGKVCGGNGGRKKGRGRFKAVGGGIASSKGVGRSGATKWFSGSETEEKRFKVWRRHAAVMGIGGRYF